MNPSVKQALSYIADLDTDRITVIAPFQLHEAEALAFLKDHRVRVVAPPPLPDLPGNGVETRLTESRDRSYPLPLADKNGVTVFLAGPAMFSAGDLLVCMLSGRWSFISRIEGLYGRHQIYRILLDFAKNEIVWRLRRMPETHFAVRSAKQCRNIDFLRRLWRGAGETDRVENRSSESSDDDGEGVFREILTALRTGTPDRADIVQGRILHVNAGLAAGGAERQICLTLTGLKRRGFSDVALLGEYRDATGDFPPYADMLESAGIPYDSLWKAPVAATLRRLPGGLAAALSQLPPDILTDILALAEEFERRRPQLVHAWQDATSVRVGIAAVMVGIPKIVLSGRNISPVSLPTYQPHYRAAYKALLQMPGVILTNNSHAGAISYAEWLDIDPKAISVIYNAVDTKRYLQSEGSDWRKRLGIPAQSPVVGGIFRLVAQKRPLLWVDAAVKLSESMPDAHFVIAGEGEMRDEILHRAKAHGLVDRFHLLGNEPAVSDLYAMFTVFLLVSESEGLANVLLEAQQAGVPVVCTNAGGNCEAVLPDRTALVVDMPDADALASALTRALRDKPWRESARLAGPHHVEASFSIEAMIEKTVTLYGIG